MNPSVKLFSIDWQVWVLRSIFDVVGHRQSYDVSKVMYPFVKCHEQSYGDVNDNYVLRTYVGTMYVYT